MVFLNGSRWIGTGVMGEAMAGHILAAGFQVTVFNRTRRYQLVKNILWHLNDCLRKIPQKVHVEVIAGHSKSEEKWLLPRTDSGRLCYWCTAKLKVWFRRGQDLQNHRLPLPSKATSSSQLSGKYDF